MSSKNVNAVWHVEAFFDDDCGICEKSAALIGRIDRGHRVRFTPLSRADLPEGPDVATLRATMHVRDRRGRWAVGGGAWTAVALAVPLLRPFGMLARLPGLRWLVSAAYVQVAQRRSRISQGLGLTACRAEIAPDVDEDPIEPAREGRSLAEP